MDKNFINIDDLVRQRLSGGEEREPAGAWLRMSELLDEEMPRKRVIGFFWRRLFSVSMVLVLIGAVTLGGYKLSTTWNGNNDATIASNETGTPGGNNAQPSNNTPTNNTAVVAATDNNNDKSNTANHKTGHANKNGNSTRSIAATTNHIANKKTTTSATTTTDAITGNDVNTTGSVAKTKHQPQPAEKKIDGNTVNHNIANQTTAENNSVVAKKGTTDNSSVAKNIPANNDVTKPTTNPTVAAADHKTEDAATGNKVAKADDTKQEVAVSNNKTKKTARSKSITKSSSTTGNDAVAMNTPKKEITKQGVPSGSDDDAANNTTESKDVHKLALGSHAPVTKPADKTNTINKPVAHKTPKTPAVKATTSVPVTVNTPAGSVAGNKAAKPATHKTAAKTGGAPEEAVVSRQKGTRNIQKLVVNQKQMKTRNGTIVFHMDTVSIENITEEFDLANNVAPKTNTNSVDNTANNTVAAIDPRSTDSSPILPASSFNESTGKADANKKSKGAMAMEGLNAAFNDIKHKAGNAQFHAGISGGINSTFFGPNSFKGFQFGATGKFVFSDALALMGELKYFHRINSGYSLNDDYYSYAPVSGGYSKQLERTSYNISTLHSLEMPVTAHYSIGNFSVFAGGNLLYMFSINTGEYPATMTPVTPVVVSAPGNDNAPKIKSNDFNSRIGLGYIFGMSFQVSPKVNIDLRDVQTFWDNANTPGGKYISSQLFRSPSFQLSIGYRFGGKKESSE